MSIWNYTPDLEVLNKVCIDTAVENLGIEFIEFTDDSLSVRMPIDKRHVQPMKQLHGGISCVLAETVGSVAANLCVDFDNYYCVGLSINCNHIRAVSEGSVTAIATPLHIGKSTHLWQINIQDDNKVLVAFSQLTIAVKKR